MKKLLFILIVCTFASIASFAQTNAELIGIWKYDGVPNAADLSPSITETYQKSFKDLNLEFGPDGKFTVSLGKSKTSGTWKIVNGKIELKYKDSKGEQIEIVKFETDKLTIRQGAVTYNITKIIT